MEKAITVIYVLAEHPETIAENVIKKIAACLLDKTTQDKEEPRNNQNGKYVVWCFKTLDKQLHNCKIAERFQ